MFFHNEYNQQRMPVLTLVEIDVEVTILNKINWELIFILHVYLHHG